MRESISLQFQLLNTMEVTLICDLLSITKVFDLLSNEVALVYFVECIVVELLGRDGNG